jgi:hypothetical protein
MGAIQDILDDGLGGIQHNAMTGKIEDLVNWAAVAVGLHHSDWRAVRSR